MRFLGGGGRAVDNDNTNNKHSNTTNDTINGINIDDISDML